MSYIKNALDEILNCNSCNGHGYIGWADKSGNYDFEFCSCNPHHLSEPVAGGVMKNYTFGVWIDIQAENDDDALSQYDFLTKNLDTYCFEWKEVK